VCARREGVVGVRGAVKTSKEAASRGSFLMTAEGANGNTRQTSKHPKVRTAPLHLGRHLLLIRASDAAAARCNRPPAAEL